MVEREAEAESDIGGQTPQGLSNPCQRGHEPPSTVSRD